MVLTDLWFAGRGYSLDGLSSSLFGDKRESHARYLIPRDRYVGNNIKLFAWDEGGGEGDCRGETRRMATC